MPLELDDRQRAMLREMGVEVWLPQQGAVSQEVATATTVAVPTPAAGVGVDASTRAAPPERPRPTAPMANGAQALGTGAAPVPSPLAPGEPMGLEAMDWPTLQQAAAACTACGLCAGRKNSTLQAPQVANQADWLVLGDPPDEDEDRLGQAFVDQAGILLDNMLKAVGARRGGSARQGAYVTSVVKCRPPNARLPQLAELQQCAQYLQREIALVQPKVIVAMGRFATQLLLQQHPQEATLPLGKQRGTVYRYQGIPVVVTYHPKVLMRANADKAKAWADLCLALDVLED